MKNVEDMADGVPQHVRVRPVRFPPHARRGGASAATSSDRPEDEAWRGADQIAGDGEFAQQSV